MSKTKLVLGIKIAVVVMALAAGTRVIGLLGGCSIPGCGAIGDSYDDKIAALRKTDPKLILYREAKRIPTGLRDPRGIAIGPDGNLYVVGDNSILVFGQDGRRVGGNTIDIEPQCISLSGDGKMFFASKDHVEVLNLQPKSSVRWPSLDKTGYITSISVLGNDVWVADAGNRVIYKYASDGRLIASFGKKDEAKGVPGLVVPSPYLDVAAVKGGSAWAANPGRHVLELYSPDGRIKRSWGKASFAIDGFSGCCNPTDFAVLPDGRFVTSEKGLPRVKIYSPAGKFIGIAAAPDTFKSDVTGLDLATDPLGKIYVLDTGTKTVRVYEPKSGLAKKGTAKK